MKVIGYRKSSFETPDTHKQITGVNIYVSTPIPEDKGSGDSCDRLFFTMDKLLDCGYKPEVGDDVTVEYNKYGKPARISLA